MNISVLICAYTEERWEDLAAAIQSVERQSLQPRETVVVIDHNPALLARVQAAFPAVKSVESCGQRGLAGARNQGVESSQGDIIAFLDDDAVAAPDWLEQLIPAYQTPDVIGVGGSIEPLWPAQHPAWFPSEFYWVVGCTYRGLPEKAAQVRNLIGANMSFRREVFERVDFFTGIGHSGGRPLGGSDPDFCIRVYQAWPGKVILYQPQAHVFHRVSPKRTSWSYFRLRCYNEGLSKSLLSRRVGSKSSLSVERSYTLHTLPQGVLRGIGDTLLHGDFGGIRRAAAIGIGLAVTGLGYIYGTALQRFAPKKWAADWKGTS